MAGLIKKDDLARVREVDFALRFGESVKKLVEVLGITRKIAKQSGAALKTYRAKGTLEDGNVAEGETIPLSHYETEAVNWGEITLKKWRKGTTAEAIVERGYDQAVDMTTDKMMKDVQKGIRGDFFAFLNEGTTAVADANLQKVAAKAWGKLNVLFDDDAVEAVFFMNPEDVADYLGTASITTQNAFGMQYMTDFLGLGTLIISGSVPKGTIYATAKENLVLYYVAANDSDLAKRFEFSFDETGLIGIHEEADYNNMTAVDTIISGIKLFAERIDGVIVGIIDATPSLGSLTVTSEAGTASGDTKITITEAKAAGNVYKYKVADAETVVTYGQNVKNWTSWDGEDDITAATGKVITVVEANAQFRADKAGHATVTAKA